MIVDMSKRGWVVVSAVVVSVAVASCGGSPAPRADAPAAHHRMVGVDEFATTIGQSDTLTINVHVPYQGDIPGTDLSIPFDRIAEQSDRLPGDRDAVIAIYCRTGPMSATAATTLKSLGYTDVVELEGGMKAWQASGRPLVGT